MIPRAIQQHWQALPIRIGKHIVLAVLALAGAILFSPVCQAQAQTTLRKIEILGLQRLSPDRVIETSGLKLGQAVDASAIDAAANRLMQSGLFKKLGYRVRTANNEATVIFEVEEAAKNLPVVFENFVWFSDEELVRAIRQDVPFFDGTSPEAGSTADKISGSLQRLLTQKHLAGQVEFLPYGDMATGKQELLFTVKGVKLPVCALHFTAASDISEEELIKNSQQLFKADYSRNDIAGFARYQLFPLYRHLGHLRAQFGEATAILENDGPCANAVSVTVPVDEGLVYSWDNSDWAGNQALPSSELVAALNMKAGEVADGLKIDQGLKAVSKAYGRKGYVAARFKESISFDDSSRRVTYQFTVTEGPQFRMGNLIINGLSPADADKLKEKWGLATGAIYDAGYLEDYSLSIRELLGQLKSRGSFKNSISMDIKPDAQKLTVDVVMTFK